MGWSISGDTSKINYLSVLLSTNNGGSYTAISSNLSPSTQSFNYTPTSGQVTTTAVVWVRAFDSSGNALAGGISSGAFTIANPAAAPTITLNSPNAGATWQVGTSQTVGWSISGDTSKINYLSVLLSTNNGGSYTAISSNLSPSTQSFNYTPTSGQVTTTAVVWVRAFDSSGNALAGGISSGAFTIANPAPAPTITLNSPNAGATWQVGTSQTVGWSISGDTSKINYLSVLLSTNNGGSYTAISSNLSPSTQSFNYTPTSGQVTTTAVVWVRAFDSSGNALAGGISSGAFTIANPAPAPTITLNSPNAGATWQVGTSQTVGWSISGDTSKINYLSVLLSTNNGGSYTAISSNLSPSTQSFNYTPTSGQVTTTAVVWVRAFDSSGNALAGAISSGAFTIVAAAPTITLNSPNAGATWQVGTSQTVGWSISGDTSKINYLSVLLSTNNGGSYTAISSNLSPSTQSFNYTPTSGQVTTTAVVWVRAFDSSGNALAGAISSGAFTISNAVVAPTITVSSPNGGETWALGVAHPITWTVSGNNTSQINKFLISYSLDGGTTWAGDAGTALSTASSISWVPPLTLTPTALARIRVEAIGASNVVLGWNMSAGNFTLGSPVIGGIDPNNMGKGDWIVDMRTAEANIGVSTVQGVIDYEKKEGMQWITVKYADGNNSTGWTTENSFNSNLVSLCHNDGIKLLAWVFAYGGEEEVAGTPNINASDVPTEITVAKQALSLGVDGLIIDAEGAYEQPGVQTPAQRATQYLQGITSAYPNAFLAYSTFWKPSAHPSFPFQVFGTSCDVAMPQVYASIHATSGMSYLIHDSQTNAIARTDADWTTQQRLWAASAIKPIVPVAYGASPVTPDEITEFANALKNDTSPATAGGYGGVSFYDGDNHTSGIWNAIGSVTIGTVTPVSSLLPPTGQKTTATGLVNDCQTSWNPEAGVDSYQVWRNTTNSSATARTISPQIKSTTYDDAIATPGVTYYYWVVATQGSQSSPFGNPTTGVANAGSATTPNLGGLELNGNFTPGGSGAIANGTIEIGFVPASGQTFQPLLTVDGSVSYNNSTISVSGTVYAEIGSLTLPLLNGGFQIHLGQAGKTETSPNTLSDTNPNGNEEIAGCPIQITSLALIPAGAGVSTPEIEVDGSISLLGTKLSAAVLITSQGLQLENGSLTLPEISFPVGPLSVDAKGMSVAYDGSQFVFTGALTLKDLIEGEPSITADLSDPGDGIFVKGNTVNLVGTLSLNDFMLPNGWGLKTASLSINTLTQAYSGNLEVYTPLFHVGGDIKFLNGHLDDLSLSLSDLASPIATPVPDLFLTGGSASIINLAPAASGPVTLSGTLDFTCEPSFDIDLPHWLGGNGKINVSIATIELGVTVSSNDFGGSATIDLADGLATLKGNADFNFATDTFTAAASVDLADGTFSGHGNVTIGNGKVVLAGTGQAQIPWHDIWSVLPNWSLPSANLYLSYQQGVPLAQDYVDIWSGSSFWIPLVGDITPAVQVGFNKSVRFIKAQDLPQIDPPASATYSVASGTPWALLSASWTNSTANVPFEIQSPDGTIYPESSLPSNVGVYDQTTSSTQVTVAIQNPASGNWTLILPDATNLGTVSFQGLGGTGTPISSVDLVFLQSPVGAVCGSEFSPPTIVAVEDQNGNVITTDNSQVTLTLAGGPGNSSTVLTTQAINGIAVFDSDAPQVAGNYTLTATDGTDNSASATLAVAPAVVSSVAFVQQPTNVVAGQDIAPAIVVQAKDQYGNVISGDMVTLAIESYPSGTLFSTFMVTTDSSGNATFSGISLPTAGTYIAVATDGAVSSGNSGTFAVSPAAASTLVFAQQPSNVIVGAPISPSVVVDVEDQFGNLVTTDNSMVTLSLNGAATLNGTQAVQAKNGVATFGGLSVSDAGVYTIDVSDGVLTSVTSLGFTVSSATAVTTVPSAPSSITYDGTTDVTNWAVSVVNGAERRGRSNRIVQRLVLYRELSHRHAPAVASDQCGHLHRRGQLRGRCQLRRVVQPSFDFRRQPRDAHFRESQFLVEHQSRNSFGCFLRYDLRWRGSPARHGKHRGDSQRRYA